MAGIAAAGAVALALWDRRRTGRGQSIEVAQRENLVGAIGEFVVGYSMTGREPARQGNSHASMAPHGCYRCAGDDHWLTIACEDDEQFASLCAVLGRPELAGDPRFSDVVSRRRNRRALGAIVSEWTEGRDKQHAAEELQAAGVPAGTVVTAAEGVSDGPPPGRGLFL